MTPSLLACVLYCALQSSMGLRADLCCTGNSHLQPERTPGDLKSEHTQHFTDTKGTLMLLHLHEVFLAVWSDCVEQVSTRDHSGLGGCNLLAGWWPPSQVNQLAYTTLPCIQTCSSSAAWFGSYNCVCSALRCLSAPAPMLTVQLQPLHLQLVLTKLLVCQQELTPLCVVHAGQVDRWPCACDGVVPDQELHLLLHQHQCRHSQPHHATVWSQVGGCCASGVKAMPAMLSRVSCAVTAACTVLHSRCFRQPAHVPRLCTCT